jgi:hypothetical protein
MTMEISAAIGIPGLSCKKIKFFWQMSPIKNKQCLTNLYQLSTTNLIQVNLRKTGWVKDYNTSKQSFSAMACSIFSSQGELFLTKLE